jgi:peptidyl-prolyl cis-trans isomerase C
MSNALFPDLTVNGEPVPQAVIAAEAQHHYAPKDKPGIAWRKAANAVAMRTLLLQEARRRGLTPKAQEIGPGRFETEEEALIRGLLDQAIRVEAPSKDAIRAEYDRDPGRFRAPPLWEVSHILIACDPRDPESREKAEVRACELADKALQAPNRFTQLASETSDCGSRATGGVLGQLCPGDTVPEFEAALHKLSEGEVTARPVLTRHGWHVIRMDALAEGAVLPFEAVKPRIADALERTAWARAAREFVATLIEQADITGADLSRPI